MGICENNKNECASVYLEGGEFHSFTQELKRKYISWNMQAFTQVSSRLTVWAQNPPANQRRGRAPHLQKRQTESERTRQQPQKPSLALRSGVHLHAGLLSKSRNGHLHLSVCSFLNLRNATSTKPLIHLTCIITMYAI